MGLLRQSCWRNCWTRPKSAQEEVLRPFPVQDNLQVVGREPVEELAAASRDGLHQVLSSRADRRLRTLSLFQLLLLMPRRVPNPGVPAAP